MTLLSRLSIKHIGRNMLAVRDKKATTLWRDQWGNGITGAWLYPIGYRSGFLSWRDRTTISPTLQRWEQSANRPSPEGLLKFIPISSRKTCRSFSRPCATHAIRNSPPNVETLVYPNVA